MHRLQGVAVVVLDVLALIGFSAVLQPFWTAREFAIFSAIVSVSCLVSGVGVSILLYALSQSVSFLFVSYHGMIGLVCGYVVAVKQYHPDSVPFPPPTPPTLRVKHVPLTVATVFLVLSLCGVISYASLWLVLNGISSSWVYLRFFQRNQQGSRGDMSESFSFASFFPEPIQPALARLGGFIYHMLVSVKVCPKIEMTYDVGAPSQINLTLPGTDRVDAQRRNFEGMASCVCEMNQGKTLLRCFPPSEKMIRAAEDGGGSERDCREASSPSSCSSRGSSRSSASLERRVNREADKDRILDKVRVLQQEAVAIKSEISGGRVDANHVKLALEMMLQEHSLLGDTVSTAALALETFNRRSGGHAASTIATCQASLREELKVLAEHLSALEEVFRSGCGLLWSSELRPPQTESIKTNNDRVLPIVVSSSSPAKIDENDSSPHLPDIYLTPSHPVYSSTSHQSPTSESISSMPHSSPPSSLPNLDPFTPDTISTPPTRDHSGVNSGVPATYSGVPTTPVSQPTHKSPQTTLVGGDCGCGSSSTTVLQWLMSSDHQTAESEEEEEEGVDGGGWRREGVRDEFSPAGSESVETGTAVSTLSPPTSSPCADSGIASSHYSSHHHPPPSSRLSSPLPLSVTMSDIEAMKAELAKLREEIRNTSNWSPSLCQEYRLYSAPSSTSLPPPPTFSISNSQPGRASASAGFKERFTACTTSSLAAAAAFDSTPAVPRPFQSLSKSHSRVSRPPLSSSSSLSGHRRLFSSPHAPLHSDQQRTLTKSHPHLVDHSVQTMPVTTPNTHSSTKSWNRTEPVYHHLHSRLPFTTHPSDPLPSYSPHTLPHNFTPHFVVQSSHYPPSFSSSPLSHLPSHSSSIGGQHHTYTTSHLSPWL
ncbi:Transmembrane protein 115 [Geodia barretti]|uniref:Transmembrane protein 115 n=1 Tax=Geodia barretti TaxID=519541 RepID=A0AA35TJU1_GEOBA|nr:Transmembrane protein 115 [Geodia barretti]